MHNLWNILGTFHNINPQSVSSDLSRDDCYKESSRPKPLPMPKGFRNGNLKAQNKNLYRCVFNALAVASSFSHDDFWQNHQNKNHYQPKGYTFLVQFFFSFQERTFWISAKRGIFSWNSNHFRNQDKSFRGEKSKNILWTNVSAKNSKAQRQGINKDCKLLIPPPQLLSKIRFPVDEHPCTDHSNGFLLTNIFPQRFFPPPLTKLFSCARQHFLVKSQYRQLRPWVQVH